MIQLATTVRSRRRNRHAVFLAGRRVATVTATINDAGTILLDGRGLRDAAEALHRTCWRPYADSVSRVYDAVLSADRRARVS